MDLNLKLKLLIFFVMTMRSEQGSILQDMEPGTPLSRFDYEYQLLKKVVGLESELSLMKKRIENIEANQDISRTMACADGWLAYKGSCYAFGPTRLSFSSAKAYCKLIDAYLVRVDNEQEDDFLRMYMDKNQKNDDYWLGISDDVKEGLWMFTDVGTEAPYLGWGGTEPQNAGPQGEDCAAFGHLLKYKWKDVPCSSVRRPLCETREMKPKGQLSD